MVGKVVATVVDMRSCTGISNTLAKVAISRLCSLFWPLVPGLSTATFPLKSAMVLDSCIAAYWGNNVFFLLRQ